MKCYTLYKEVKYRFDKCTTFINTILQNEYHVIKISGKVSKLHPQIGHNVQAMVELIIGEHNREDITSRSYLGDGEANSLVSTGNILYLAILSELELDTD